LKIALVSAYDYPYPGGVTKHISNLATQFTKNDHDVRVIALSSLPESELDDYVIKVSSMVIPIRVSGSVARVALSPTIYTKVKKILRKEQFDIVHLHEPLMPALPLVALRHSKSVNVATFHAYRDSNVGYRYTRHVARRFISKLDGRIVVSSAALESVGRYFPGEYVIIPNGIDVERFGDTNLKPIEKLADGKANVLFVGRLEKRKGFRYLLRAFARVKSVVPEARLVVVGAFDKDDQPPFERFIRKYGIGDVLFEGYASEDDLPRYYRSCDIFCAPSTGFESFGMVLLEAMAAGKAIVASDIPGYRTVVTHGEEGFLLKPKDPQALAEALLTLLRDAPLRERMGRKGLETAAWYSWDRVSDQLLDYYAQLMRRKREGESGDQ
jgi:phosphatidylinositol alpha-mannosyltransferase